MEKKFKLEKDENRLTLKLKTQMNAFKILFFGLLIQDSAALYTITHELNDKVSTNLMLSLILMIASSTIFLIWYLAWSLISKKKFELNSEGAKYSRKLFNKIKTQKFKWSEIEKFTTTKNNESYIVAIKSPTGKEIELFGGEKDEINYIATQFNSFKNNLTKTSQTSHAPHREIALDYA